MAVIVLTAIILLKALLQQLVLKAKFMLSGAGRADLSLQNLLTAEKLFPKVK
jgi:hypothetical protein